MKDILKEGALEIAFVESSHAAAGPLSYPELVERAEFGGAGIKPHVLREVIWSQVDLGAWHFADALKVVPHRRGKTPHE